MVSEPVFHSARLAVVKIENLRIASRRATVMHHDIFPLAQPLLGGINLAAGWTHKSRRGRLGRRGSRGGWLGSFDCSFGRNGIGLRRAHAQEGACLQLVPPEPVPTAQIFQRDVLLAGDFDQSVPGFDSHPFGFGCLYGAGLGLWHLRLFSGKFQDVPRMESFRLKTRIGLQ